MKKQFMVMVLMGFCIFPAISLADFWIEYDYSTYHRYTIITDNMEDVYSYEIYLGVFGDAYSISALPNAGHNTSVSQTDFDQYPSTYHLQSGPYPIEGEQFEFFSWSHFFALYDSNHQVIGSYSNHLDSGVLLYLPQTYTIGPGQSVDLIGYSYKIPGYAGWVAGTDYSEPCMDNWSIHGQPIPQQVSYEYLTRQLGLEPGTHVIDVYQDWVYGWVDNEPLIYQAWETTTITIVPEPVSLLLLGLGGLLIKKR